MVQKSEIAVVIPLYKEEPDELEIVSLKQCFGILSDYKIIFLTHKSLNTNKYLEILKISGNPAPESVFFSKKNFANIKGYNQLLLSLFFYLRFIRYKYILIYQLDAFVFRDELLQWAQADYCYIGAPWLSYWKKSTKSDAILGVGNGGFSLRRVKSYIRALLSFSFVKSPEELRTRIFSNNKSRFIQWMTYLLNLTVKNNIFFLFNSYTANEDGFWGLLINEKFKWFRVAEPEEASKFSIEVQPGEFYIRNHSRLPFGCHAWNKFEYEFWKPHIESFGYTLP